ncbi:MAG: helix-hairpin-helix domain-containing protein [Bacteroidota bacterium]
MNDFFDLIATFFAELTNEDKILLGILAILVFMIGFIVGWIMQGTKTRRYKKELLLLRKDRDEYEVRYRATETKQKALAKELEQTSREKVEALERLQAMEADQTKLTELQSERDTLITTNQSLSAQIASLEEQVTTLKAQKEELETGTVAPRDLGNTNVGAGAGAGTVSSSNESLNAYIALNESRLQSLEDRLLRLAQENAVLKNQADQTTPITNRGHVVQMPEIDPALTTSTAPAVEPLVIRADTTDPGVRTGQTGGTEVIVQTTPSVHVPTIQDSSNPYRDDLTMIKDIGPFLQGELHKADIYTFEQIANWSEADIITYTELIGYLPGIIQRDDWIGQAQRLLAAAESTKPATFEAESNEEDPVAEDDLKVIEGVGPKIESVLKASGITTMNTLAETSVEQLREILASAGSRFKSHDPKTWPVQAGLAADGKLKELKAWQKELKNG